MNIQSRPLFHILCVALIFSSRSIYKPYDYKWFPDNYAEIKHGFESYYHLTACQPGETIASIGAGNGLTKIHQLFNEDGMLVIIERMGKKVGEIHGDCKYPKLIGVDFLQEMKDYRYIGKEITTLMFYTFESKI